MPKTICHSYYLHSSFNLLISLTYERNFSPSLFVIKTLLIEFFILFFLKFPVIRPPVCGSHTLLPFSVCIYAGMPHIPQKKPVTTHSNRVDRSFVHTAEGEDCDEVDDNECADSVMMLNFYFQNKFGLL